MIRVLSLLMFGIGVFVLVQLMLPLASYKLWEVSAYYQNMVLADPTPEQGVVLGVAVEQVGDFPAIISDKKLRVEVPYKEFNLTIPSINLAKAKVVVETNDFDSNLSHLPGSALPGEVGNVFVTGHSSLTQLFGQNNYKAIFANLPQVKKGDLIEVRADGVKYEYLIEGLRVVDPKETWVVNPPDRKGKIYVANDVCTTWAEH